MGKRFSNESFGKRTICLEFNNTILKYFLYYENNPFSSFFNIFFIVVLYKIRIWGRPDVQTAHRRRFEKCIGENPFIAQWVRLKYILKRGKTNE